MKRSAVYGVGIGINGREAAMQATQRALNQLGSAKPVLALVFVAQELDTGEVVAGLTSLLGETPLWGFSTIAPLTGEGDQLRSVVVALLAGSDLQARVHWFPDYASDSQAAARQLFDMLRQDIFLPQDLLIAADGICGSLEPVAEVLANLPVTVSGCMASGDPIQGMTRQIGKNQAGPGGLSVAMLDGRFRLGAAIARGWQDLGVFFRVTKAQDVCLQELDNLPAAEVYAHYFGYLVQDWSSAPLSEMIRLYPLGIEVGEAGIHVPGLAAGQLLIRSALGVGTDGSLRLSAPAPEGALVHLMTGSLDGCLDAARTAAHLAIDRLGGAKPLLAVALVDAAWQMLFEVRPAQVAVALKAALGDIPLVGAYTFGQFVRPDYNLPPVLHNQDLALLVLGEEDK